MAQAQTRCRINLCNKINICTHRCASSLLQRYLQRKKNKPWKNRQIKSKIPSTWKYLRLTDDDDDRKDKEGDPVVPQTVTVQGRSGGRSRTILCVGWCLTCSLTTSTSTTRLLNFMFCGRWMKIYTKTSNIWNANVWSSLTDWAWAQD